MKRIVNLCVVCHVVAILWINAGWASATPEISRNASPFFSENILESEAAESMALESIAVKADITGVAANVTLTQTFRSRYEKPENVQYIFPADKNTAVYEIKATIGERIITAQSESWRNDAEKIDKFLEDFKNKSKYLGKNLYKMDIVDILPDDVVRMEVKYFEIVPPQNGIYAFVFPGYPYLENSADPPKVSIDVHLSAGMTIQELECDTHHVSVNPIDPTSAEVSFKASEIADIRRDFVLRYRLSGSDINAGVFLFKGKTENFFMAMIQPPQWVSQDDIPLREYIFLVDISGSMIGFPIAAAKRIIRQLVSKLRYQDTFNVMLFSGGAEILGKRSVEASKENIDKAIQLIESVQGGGGIELEWALLKALALPENQGVSRNIVIITDGYIEGEERVFDFIRNSRTHISVFGVGAKANRPLIEVMSHVGMKKTFIASTPETAVQVIEEFIEYISTPLLKDIKIKTDGFQAYDILQPSFAGLFSTYPFIIAGKWWGKPTGKMVISAESGDEAYEKTINIAALAPQPFHSGVEFIWAQSEIDALTDAHFISPDKEKIAEIGSLGNRYNMYTKYTSYGALEKRIQKGRAFARLHPLLVIPVGKHAPEKKPLVDEPASIEIVKTKKQTKRQPFTPLQMMEYSQLKLVGIIHSDEGNKALLEDISGKGYTVGEGTSIGPNSGKIAEILNDRIVLEEEITVKGKPVIRKRHIRIHKHSAAGKVGNMTERMLVSGEIPKKELDEAMAKYIEEIEICYRNVLPKKPDLTGDALLRIVVDPRGGISDTELVSQSVYHQELADCIDGMSKQWRFPAPTDGMSATVEYLLVFDLH